MTFYRYESYDVLIHVEVKSGQPIYFTKKGRGELVMLS
jgi:hypothetical protein